MILWPVLRLYFGLLEKIVALKRYTPSKDSRTKKTKVEKDSRTIIWGFTVSQQWRAYVKEQIQMWFKVSNILVPEKSMTIHCLWTFHCMKTILPNISLVSVWIKQLLKFWETGENHCLSKMKKTIKMGWPIPILVRNFSLQDTFGQSYSVLSLFGIIPFRSQVLLGTVFFSVLALFGTIPFRHLSFLVLGPFWYQNFSVPSYSCILDLLSWYQKGLVP